MNRDSRRRWGACASASAALVLLSAAAPKAWACAVCFGDPDAPETKGAAAGVLVLAAIVYGVLVSLGSITLYWVIRARRMPHP